MDGNTGNEWKQWQLILWTWVGMMKMMEISGNGGNYWGRWKILELMEMIGDVGCEWKWCHLQFAKKKKRESWIYKVEQELRCMWMVSPQRGQIVDVDGPLTSYIHVTGIFCGGNWPQMKWTGIHNGAKVYQNQPRGEVIGNSDNGSNDNANHSDENRINDSDDDSNNSDRQH